MSQSVKRKIVPNCIRKKCHQELACREIEIGITLSSPVGSCGGILLCWARKQMDCWSLHIKNYSILTSSHYSNSTLPAITANICNRGHFFHNLCLSVCFAQPPHASSVSADSCDRLPHKID